MLKDKTIRWWVRSQPKK